MSVAHACLKTGTAFVVSPLGSIRSVCGILKEYWAGGSATLMIGNGDSSQENGAPLHSFSYFLDETHSLRFDGRFFCCCRF